MSQIELLKTDLPSLPNLARLSTFLGRPYRTEDKAISFTQCWGKLGGSELKIVYNKQYDDFSIYLHLFIRDSSYRKSDHGLTVEATQSWLDLNTDFIVENMSK